MHVLLWLVIAYFGSLAFMVFVRWMDGEVAEFHRRERERIEELRRRRGLPSKPRAMRTLASWSLESEEQLKSLWGNDADQDIIRQGLELIEAEGDRAVRNHLIAMSAVEEAFAGWELRERYRQVPGEPVPA